MRKWNDWDDRSRLTGFDHKFRLSILLLMVSLLILTACGSESAAEPAPPVIHYGEDICEFCGMIISDERYAAGYITEDGQERIFDDLAGMFVAHLEKQEDVRAFFVHDYEDTKWIRAETASYVLSEELPTPMLFGLAACSSSEKAEKLASDVGGEVLSFDEVLVHYQDHAPMATMGGAEHTHNNTHDQ